MQKREFDEKAALALPEVAVVVEVDDSDYGVVELDILDVELRNDRMIIKTRNVFDQQFG